MILYFFRKDNTLNRKIHIFANSSSDMDAYHIEN